MRFGMEKKATEGHCVNSEFPLTYGGQAAPFHSINNMRSRCVRSFNLIVTLRGAVSFCWNLFFSVAVQLVLRGQLNTLAQETTWGKDGVNKDAFCLACSHFYHLKAPHSQKPLSPKQTGTPGCYKKKKGRESMTITYSRMKGSRQGNARTQCSFEAKMLQEKSKCL